MNQKLENFKKNENIIVKNEEFLNNKFIKRR